MKLIIELDPTNKAEVADALAILGVNAASDVTATVNKVEAPKAKAEKPAAPKAKSSPKKAAIVEEDDEDEEESEFTLDDVRAKAKELITNGNRDAVKEILEGLGVDRVTKLTEAQYAKFIEAADQL